MNNQTQIICPYCPEGVVMYKTYKHYQCPRCHSTSPDIFWCDEMDFMSEDERSNLVTKLAIRRYTGGDCT